jgi:hypothetical protein
MSRATLQSAPDERPRLIVIIPVIVICLGSILLLFFSQRSVRLKSGAPQGQDVTVNVQPNSEPGSSVANRRVTSKTTFRPTAFVTRQSEPPLAAETAAPDAKPPSPRWTGAVVPGSPADSAPVGGALPIDLGIQIQGRVTIEGTPPKEIRIDMTSDPQCGRLHTTPITTRHYLVDSKGGLANVLVYVKSGVSENFPVPAAQPLLNQTGCLYEPYVMGLMVGQKFKIRNSDPLVHNVHATPKVNREFNFAQPTKYQVAEKSFDQPEILVRFKCDVHPWMFAYVGVVAHPFYAVTGTDGTFLLPPDLPPGTYTLEAVHPKAGNATQEIVVNAGERKTVDFRLRVPAS